MMKYEPVNTLIISKCIYEWSLTVTPQLSTFQEKKNELESFSGDVVLRGDDFKRYVASLRGKSNMYKKKRSELSDLRSEYGVLSRSVPLFIYCIL